MMRARSAGKFALWLVLAGALPAGLAFWWLHRSASGSPTAQSIPADPSKGWSSFGGTWIPAQGAIRNESEDRGPKLMSGSLRWENYFVEADVRLLGPYGDAGLILRSHGEEQGVDSYHGYYAGIRNMDNSLILGRADFGWNEYVTQPIFPQVAGWYHIKLLAYGCSIAASVTNSSGFVRRAYLKDPQCIPAGRFGLKSYEASAEWKNIRVGPSNPQALAEMTQGVAPVIVSYKLSTSDSGPDIGILSRYTGPMQREAGKHHFTLGTQPAGSFASTATPDLAPVTVRGVVTLVSPVLYVQDASGGIVVQPLNSATPVRIGDEVEARGYLSRQDSFPALSHTSIQMLWPNAPVPPVAVSAFGLATGNNKGRFVETEGELLAKAVRSDQSLVLTMKNGSQEFYAITDRGSTKSTAKRLTAGSWLRLRGVVTSDSTFTKNLVPFALLLPSVDDIAVASLPSWWSPTHIVATLVVLLLLALATHLFLRRIEHWRHTAVLAERERLALDMHDTLAQCFAGIAFQLQAARDEARERGLPYRQVEAALEMVRRSHTEAKRSMAVLRPRTAESSSIADSLKQVAERLSDGGPLVVRSSATGNSSALPLKLADTFFLIGQEAVSNCVRHAGASLLEISLHVDQSNAQLFIKDNGCGFTGGAPHYGFGIRGMEKRAAAANAHLEVSSSPCIGTTVSVQAHLSQPHQPWRRSAKALLFQRIRTKEAASQQVGD